MNTTRACVAQDSTFIPAMNCEIHYNIDSCTVWPACCIVRLNSINVTPKMTLRSTDLTPKLASTMGTRIFLFWRSALPFRTGPKTSLELSAP